MCSFQLPLSGSPDILAHANRYQPLPPLLSTPSLGITPCFRVSTPSSENRFQLPLSGSQKPAVVSPEHDVAFNSLSRDHGRRRFRISGEIVRLGESFNSLSRDHLRAFSISVIGPHPRGFQLPLSGSPSPIPGFSGSPRLSAAAPLRTNEF